MAVFVNTLLQDLSGKKLLFVILKSKHLNKTAVPVMARFAIVYNVCNISCFKVVLSDCVTPFRNSDVSIE